MGKPGTVFYFDWRKALSRLDKEQKGELLDAILDFAEFGVMPDDLSEKAAIAFDFIKPRLERDDSRYGAVVSQKQYAVYCREARRKEQEPLTFKEWSKGSGDIIR